MYVRADNSIQNVTSSKGLQKNLAEQLLSYACSLQAWRANCLQSQHSFFFFFFMKPSIIFPTIPTTFLEKLHNSSGNIFIMQNSKLTKHYIITGISTQVLLIQVWGKNLNVSPTTINLLLMFHCILNDQSLPFVTKWFKSWGDCIKFGVLTSLKTCKDN